MHYLVCQDYQRHQGDHPATPHTAGLMRKVGGSTAMLDVIADITVIATLVTTGGLFLVKWAITPVVVAFGAGMALGKILGRRENGRHARTTATAAR